MRRLGEPAATRGFPDETREQAFGHLQLLNIPLALSLRAEARPRALATVQRGLMEQRACEVSFAVLIGSDPFLHFKEPSARNIPVLAEREETVSPSWLYFWRVSQRPVR